VLREGKTCDLLLSTFTSAPTNALASLNFKKLGICFTQVIAVGDRVVNRTSVSAVGGLDIVP
jgi:hypothetical protein